MDSRLSSWTLTIVVISFVLILTSCGTSSPGEWVKEEIVTEYGDRFEHLYRLWPGGFPDPDYEHRILFGGKEILSYNTDNAKIEYIYKDNEIRVYEMLLKLIYRKSEENVFRILPIDLDEKKFYPAYYQLLLRADMYTDVTKMLLSSGDKYAQKVVLAYAQGDFSEAYKHGINMKPSEIKTRTAFCSELVEEYHLSK